MTSRRVKGHALIAEGAAHFADSGVKREIWGEPIRWGPGCAKCECGAMSGVLGSQEQRYAWHREHKSTVAGI